MLRGVERQDQRGKAAQKHATMDTTGNGIHGWILCRSPDAATPKMARLFPLPTVSLPLERQRCGPCQPGPTAQEKPMREQIRAEGPIQIRDTSLEPDCAGFQPLTIGWTINLGRWRGWYDDGPLAIRKGRCRLGNAAAKQTRALSRARSGPGMVRGAPRVRPCYP